MRKKKTIFSVFLVLVVVSMFGVVTSEMLISSANVSYDSAIIEALDNQSNVRIIVELSPSLDKDFVVLLKEDILSNLSSSEFTLKQNINGSYWFSGEITKEGLEKLKLNENIIRIYLPISGSTTDAPCGDGVCDIEENCKLCDVDCGCSEQEECVKGECEIKKITNSKNSLWFWATPVLITFFLIVIIYFVKRKSNSLKKGEK